MVNEMLNGRWNVVREFLNNCPAAINAHSHHGRTLLYHAAATGRAAMVVLLMEKGADINAKDNNDTTPLMVAVGSGHRKIVELLLEKGAVVNGQDMFSWSALMYAASVSNNDYIVEDLLENGASVLDKDSGGETALDIAIRKKDNKGAVKLLEAAEQVELEKERIRLEKVAADRKRWLEETDFSKGLKHAIPAPRPIKSPKRAL